VFSFVAVAVGVAIVDAESLAGRVAPKVEFILLSGPLSLQQQPPKKLFLFVRDTLKKQFKLTGDDSFVKILKLNLVERSLVTYDMT